MLINNLKIAIRNLLKNKYITAVNLCGLIVGMTSALLIWQYVAFEKSYENFQENSDQIYRVVTNRYIEGQLTMEFAAGAAGAGRVLKENFPEIEDYVKIRSSRDVVISVDNKDVREEMVFFAGESFYSIFSYELLSGDPATCLKEPLTACFSEKAAKKHFGNTDPIGKTFRINGNREYTVTGIFADMPANSHLHFDVLLSYRTFAEVISPGDNSETQMYWDGFYTYLLMKPGVDPQQMETKFKTLIDANYGEELADMNSDMYFPLQPLKDIHLTSHHLFEVLPNGDGNAIWFLMIIGSLVLLIAWFNYINLSTARAETRAKEVGVRKVVGSSRGHLMSLFLVESSLVNLLAILISMALAQALMPSFEELAGKEIPLTIFTSPKVGLLILSIFLGGTLLAGLYPAFVLSSFQPISVLKSSGSPRKGRGVLLRKGLVITQFVTSITLIIGTIVVFKQLHHMQSAKLGVNIEQTMVMESPPVIDSTFNLKYKSFKDELLGYSKIQSVTSSSAVPGSQFNWTAGGIRKWGADSNTSKNVLAMAVDFDFLDTYEMELLAGKTMNKNLHTDSTACMLNETAVKMLGLGTPEEVVGLHLDFWGDRLEIVGVVKDFHQQSPKMDFDPLVIRAINTDNSSNYISVKFNPEDFSKTLATVQDKWISFFPGNPFEYFFLDEHFAKQYAADQRMGRVFGLFALLAIFVSCLGLFALASFMAEKRRKEIGIRKVLGASIESLIGLLFKDFFWLVSISILIATPIAWLTMSKWLEAFASRISMQWWFFLIAGLGALAIALLTVSVQSLRVASANPVKALKEE